MNTTNEQMGRFDWHEFSEGRARFIGGVRGPDELGHDGFVIEAVGFPAMYGEIIRRFAANKNEYDLEILAFGWPGKERNGLAYQCQVCAIDFLRKN